MSDWYQGQENSEGLLAIADETEKVPQLSAFAQYCRHRVSGLRKLAFQSLERFLAEARQWPEAEQRRFVNWLCRTDQALPHVDHLIPHQLKTGLVVPVLEAWIATEPSNAVPHRWLGHITHDRGCFETALSLDPADDISRAAIVSREIDRLDHACHHLPEFFIGIPSEVLAVAEEANELIAGLRDEGLRKALQQELQDSRQQVLDWIEFQTADAADFDKWCAGRGYKYIRPAVVWYERR